MAQNPSKSHGTNAGAAKAGGVKTSGKLSESQGASKSRSGQAGKLDESTPGAPPAHAAMPGKGASASGARSAAASPQAPAQKTAAEQAPQTSGSGDPGSAGTERHEGQGDRPRGAQTISMPSRRVQPGAQGSQRGRSVQQGSAGQHASEESDQSRREHGGRDTRQQTPARRNAASAARSPVPANDDMPSIGGLVYALNQRPSRSPFMVAGIASLVWGVLGIAVGTSVMSKYGADIDGIVDFLANPAMLGVMAGTVVPIAVFWFLAFLIWRAQELRLMSSAMTEVAVRLAEPDKMAEQSVASLGQTVRRQVAAMNDAISRALGRAGELEALVHNEVTALERSYSENEHRIRSLINELASEREALANNSSRVSEALRGIGGDVRREIQAASDEATQSLDKATTNLTETFANRSQKITAAVTEAGDAVDAKLAERGAQVNEQLTKHSAKTVDNIHQQSLQVTTAIQQASDRASAAISAKSNSLVHSVMSMSERVAQEIPALLDRLGGEQQRLNSIISDATTNLTNLESALSEKTQALDSSLNDKTRVLQGVLTEHSKAIDNSLSERTRALESLLGQRAKEFHNTIGAGTKHIEDSIVARAQALEEALSRQSGSIRDTLDQHAQKMDKSLSRQAQEIERSVSNSSESIERAVGELADRTGASSEALESQAETLRQMSSGLLNQIQGLTKRFEEQGATIMKSAKALEVSNTQVDHVMEQRQAQLAKLIDTIGKRASELDKMMHNYSGMLEDSLSRAETRARGVTEMLANDSAEKSQSAVREIERLRSETQAQTFEAIEELKGRFAALSDQIGEQLNTLTSRFSETSETVKDTTRRASMDLETTNTELRRQAKAIPETTRESATAMRKALQDQLAALDSLSDIANRHRYSGTVSRSEQSAERDSGAGQVPATRDGSSRDAGTGAPPPARRQPQRENYEWPAQRGGGQRPQKPAPWEGDAAPQRNSQQRGRPASRSDDDFSALTAGLIDRLDGNKRNQKDDEPGYGEDTGGSGREGRGAGASRQGASPGWEQDDAEKPAGEWSLGDLLARASEADDELSLEDEQSFGSGDDESYGRPPQLAPEPAPRAPQQPAQSADQGVDFNMKDIADAVDQDTVVEVWRRYNRGDRSVISRDVYNRQGKSTFDQVQRRYRSDQAFRHIADRYMADFEKVLKDASKSGQNGKALQNYLVSETGKIYLMLAHASGRLD
ncbi:MAG: hypothetical protein ACLFPA_04810 [Dichotomicrobium sp.]